MCMQWSKLIFCRQPLEKETKDTFRFQAGSDWMEGNDSNNVTGDRIGRKTSQGNEWTNEGEYCRLGRAT